MTLLEALQGHNVSILPDFSSPIYQRQGPEFLKATKFMVGTTEHMHVHFGRFDGRMDGDWRSSTGGMTKKELKEFSDAIDKITAENKRIMHESYERTAQELVTWFTPLAQATATPYTRGKQISHYHGAKISLAPPSHQPLKGANLVIPLYDINKKLWSLQHIFDDGFKSLAQGARGSGGMYLLETTHHTWFLDAPERIYIVEGFATGCSVQEALGDEAYVVCAFSATQLGNVGQALRNRFATTELVFLADNDAYKKNAEGKAHNPGIYESRRAAGNLKPARVMWPVFRHPHKKFTDYNDLKCAEGIDMVRDQIENPTKYVTGIQPMLLRTAKNGQTIKPTEHEVATYIKEHYGDNITEFQECLFRYKDNYWQEFLKGHLKILRRQIIVASDYTFDFQAATNCLKHFRDFTDDPPERMNLFKPNKYMTAFQDKTVHFVKDGAGRYRTEVREHAREDYATRILPFDLPPSDTPAPLLDAYLHKVWSQDADVEEKVRLFKQIIGACLLPAFPVIVYFVGPPKTGKSTLIKLLIKLIGEDVNTCNCPPTKWNHSFGMEPLINKLVNYDTDMDTHNTWAIDQVKKVIDGMSILVNRKWEKGVSASLAPVHLFAGNALPKILEDESEALGRRLIIFKTDSFKVEGDIKDYEEHILDSERAGVVAWGLQGINDLLAQGGIYSITKHSQVMVEKMGSEHDLYAQFVDDLLNEKVKSKTTEIVRRDEDKMTSQQMWESFVGWDGFQKARATDSEHSAKRKLHKALRKKNIVAENKNSVDWFLGWGVKERPSSD